VFAADLHGAGSHEIAELRLRKEPEARQAHLALVTLLLRGGCLPGSRKV